MFCFLIIIIYVCQPVYKPNITTDDKCKKAVKDTLEFENNPKKIILISYYQIPTQNFINSV